MLPEAPADDGSAIQYDVSCDSITMSKIPSNDDDVFQPVVPKTLNGVVVSGSGGSWKEHRRTLLASLSAAIGSISMGAVLGYTSPAIPDINSGSGNPFHLEESDIALVASIISIGGLLGEPLGGFLADRRGRRSMLILFAVPFITGWLIIAAANTVALLNLGRFITGFASGVIDIIVPVYITEISDHSVRGFMGSCHEMSTNIGLMFVFTFGCFLKWKWLAVACSFLPVIMLFLMLFMPESPRWLLGKGYHQEAKRTLRWLRGPEADVKREMLLIEESVRMCGAAGQQIKWRDFGQPALYRPFAIVVGILFCQQFSGYGVIPEFLVSIFQSAGSSWNPYVQTAVVGVAGVAANFLSAWVVDKAGRRRMLVISAIVMTTSMATLTVYFIVKQQREANVNVVALRDWLPALSLIGYSFGAALGYGPVPFYLAGELFPLRARGLAGGLSISFAWVFQFITTISFPGLLHVVRDSGMYGILAGFSSLGIVFAVVAVPETKGKTLEELERAATL